MNKLVKVVTLVSVISVATAFTYNGLTPKEVEKPKKNTAIVSVKEKAVPEIEENQTEEVPTTVVTPNELEQTTPQAVEPAPTPVLSENEQLMKQYGWDAGAKNDSIKFIIARYPGKFSNGNSAASFDYLNKVAEASPGGITEVYVYLAGLQGTGTDNPYVWERLARRVGIGV